MYNTPEFQALRREYLEGAVERANHLQHQLDQFQAGQPFELKALRQEVHKLRGSGGFYGFRDLSEAAAKAEDTLIMVLDDELEQDDQQIFGLVERVVQAVNTAATEFAAGGGAQGP